MPSIQRSTLEPGVIPRSGGVPHVPFTTAGLRLKRSSPLHSARTVVRLFLQTRGLCASSSMSVLDGDIAMWKDWGTCAMHLDLEISHWESALPINLMGDAKMRELNNTEMDLAGGGVGQGSFAGNTSRQQFLAWVSGLTNGLPNNHTPAPIPGGAPLH